MDFEAGFIQRIFAQFVDMPPRDLMFLFDYMLDFCCIPGPTLAALSIFVMLSVYLRWSSVRFVSVFYFASVSFRMILFLYMRR